MKRYPTFAYVWSAAACLTFLTFTLALPAVNASRQSDDSAQRDGSVGSAVKPESEDNLEATRSNTALPSRTHTLLFEIETITYALDIPEERALRGLEPNQIGIGRDVKVM